MAVERVQAPAGGVNTDASPEYVGIAQAADLANLLPGFQGRVSMRGPVTWSSGQLTSSVAHPLSGLKPNAFWPFGDIALVSGENSAGTAKRWAIDFFSKTVTDITASVAAVTGNSARYGAKVYGSKSNGDLVSWDGVTTLTTMTNAPKNFLDVQTHMNRLFVLAQTGSTAPDGTTTAGATLYWSDADPAADLSLLNSWKNDVSGLMEKIVVDTADTPIALAGCGKYLAIVCDQSIHLLTGSGSSSFAIRTLTRSWGCVDINTVVESDEGFYFLGTRGYCYCDGSTVTVVSTNAVTREMQQVTPAADHYAALFDHGYIAVCRVEDTANSIEAKTWLYSAEARAWTTFDCDIYADKRAAGVFRTASYPVIWLGGAGLRCEAVTRTILPLDVGGIDTDGAGSPTTAATSITWLSRAARLASPGLVAKIQRLFLEYQIKASNSPAAAIQVRLLTTDGTVLFTQTLNSVTPTRRQRAVMEVFGEADSIQLEVTDATTGKPTVTTFELFDAYIEFVPAQNRASI